MTEYLTIDVGGTEIKYGVMDAAGCLKSRGKQLTPKELGEFISQIQDLIDHYQKHVAGFALSTPGKVDIETGTIYFGGALSFLDGFCLSQSLETYGKPITIQNDGKAAALAELWLGNLHDIKNGAALILGTGVGGGIILDGKLRMGPHFQAGEFSFMSTDFDEDGLALAGFQNSAVEMVRQINTITDYTNKTDGLAAFSAIETGNTEALRIFQRYCHRIANQIFTLQGVLDLERYVIGGGISAQPILIEEIKRQFELIRNSHSLIKLNLPNDIDILPAKFGNDANLYGALYSFLEQQEGQFTVFK